MIKPLTLITGLAMAAAIGHTFEVKRHVAALDRELRDIRRTTEEVEARTQILQAEWARLNDQERLSNLAERHLSGMVPMQASQFQRLDEAVRRLPVAVAWASPASPFAPREEGTAVAAARPAPEAPRPAVEAAARPAAEAPAREAPARPAGEAPGRPATMAAARPVAEPAVRPSPPVVPARPAEPAAAPRPQVLADAARAPRPMAAEPTPRPAPLAIAPPSPAQSLPPVAAPPAPRPPAAAAPAPPPAAFARVPPQPPQMQAEARRPPAMAAARAPDNASLPAVASPIRAAVLVQRADAGSMLGGQTSAMAPPVPYGR